MNVINIYIIGLLALVLSLFVIFYLLKAKVNKRLLALETQVESYEFVIEELKIHNQQFELSFQTEIKNVQAWQLEHHQVSQQLEHRIKVLQEKLNATNEFMQNIQQQQPEDKLYTRAQKMVLLGADIDEVVRECELPFAEAEILIAMHKKNHK